MKSSLPKNRKCPQKHGTSHFACPGSVAEILALIEQVRHDEIKVDEVVEAIIDPNEVLLNELGLSHLDNNADNAVNDDDSSDDDADLDDEDEDGGTADAHGQRQSGRAETNVLEHFADIRQTYDLMWRLRSTNTTASTLTTWHTATPLPANVSKCVLQPVKSKASAAAIAPTCRQHSQARTRNSRYLYRPRKWIEITSSATSCPISLTSTGLAKKSPKVAYGAMLWSVSNTPF